jgi:prevent-host-death family protein
MAAMTTNARRRRAGTRLAGAGAASTLLVTATQAKNEFSRLLETAIAGRAVVITKHGTAKAVLLSKVEFEALSRTGDVDSDALDREFDAMLARMQTSRARTAMRRSFGALPDEVGRAAAAAARRRG